MVPADSFQGVTVAAHQGLRPGDVYQAMGILQGLVEAGVPLW